MKKLFTIIAAWLVAITVWSQEIMTPLRSDLIPPTPTSARLVECQRPTPSLLTGAASFAIPLYSIDVDGMSIPITLQYQSNGIKVFDHAGPVGLGWSLSPALRATRTIMGRPDGEYEFHGTDTFSDDNSYLNAFRSLANCIGLGNACVTAWDTQHDIFTFSLPGKNITRVLDASSKPYQFLGADDMEYKISATDDLTKITVTGPDGVKYYFGSPFETQNIDNISVNPITGWALQRIELANGRYIDMKWSEAKFSSPTITYMGGATLIDDRDSFEFFNYPTPEDFENSSLVNGSLSKNYVNDGNIRLERITYPGGKIEFSYQPSYLSAFIKSIKIFNNLSQTAVRVVDLEYAQTGYAHHVLKSVDLGENQKYTFDYYSHELGISNPHAQDWWGYYNAKEDNPSLEPSLEIRTLMKNVDCTNRYNCHIGNADRSINAEAMKNDILKVIHYPTGATATFEYEPHLFAPTRMENDANVHPASDPYLSEGGGLRVTKITMRNSSSDTNPTVVKYEYPLANVTAVPSAATFFNVVQGAFPKGLWGSLSGKNLFFVRFLSLLPSSDYLRYDIGRTPLWYSKVTEVFDEGKTEYYFKDYILHGNSFIDSFGERIINELGSIFTKGPQLNQTITYKGVPGSYKKVSSIRNYYSVPYCGSITNAHVIRAMIQIGTNSQTAPDFDEGHLMYQAGPYGYTPDLFYDYDNYRSPFPYKVYHYGILFQTEQLDASVTTEYYDNGDSLSVRRDFTYKPMTTIPTGVATSCAGQSSNMTTTYASASSASAIEQAMYAANAVSLPLSITTTLDGASTTTRAEYAATADGRFRPRRVLTWHHGCTDTLESAVYTYDGHNIASITDADGVTSAFLWGYDKTRLTAVGDNMTPAQLASQAQSTAAGRHVTSFEWLPGLGMSSATTPYGATNRYTYDSNGRLLTTALDGLGTLTANEYHVEPDNNYVSNYTHSSASGDLPKTITTKYDNRGRETEVCDLYGGTGGPLTLTSSVYVKSVYDKMGRLVQKSYPQASSTNRLLPSQYIDYGYEQSPRGLQTSELKGGEAWKNAGKAMTTELRTNSGTAEWCFEKLEVSGSGGITLKGNWPTGSLTVKAVTDEDGHTVIEATDFQGRLIATREGATGDWLTTRYVYDSYGRLRFVLQPILDAKNYAATDTDLADFAFEYRYDDADRCVYSHIPGCEASQMSYSRAGRMVAQHFPGTAASEWRLYYYDAYGRCVLEGTAKPSAAQLTALASNTPLATLATSGYTCSGGFPTGFARKTERYFDNYTFTEIHGKDVAFKAVAGYAASPLADCTSLATGTADWGSDNALRLEAYYYDSFGRMVQTRSFSPEGTLTRSTRYKYHGAVEAERTEAKQASLATTDVMETTTKYNRSLRPITVTTVFNTDTVAVNYYYNKLGQVEKIEYGDSLARSFLYDVHGWTTKVTTSLATGQAANAPLANSFYAAVTSTPALPNITIIDPPALPVKPTLHAAFTEQIFYADATRPRYTGEMGARKTTLGGRYDYTFDAHDRLTAAVYTPGADADPDEDFSTRYSYDAIGRPTAMKRNGVVSFENGAERFGTRDDLLYTYSGAVLSQITASPRLTQGYNPINTAVGTYRYNAAGGMTYDSSRGITAITYNHLGQPLNTTASDARRMYIAGNTYTSQGTLAAWKHVQQSGSSVATPVEECRKLGNFDYRKQGMKKFALERADFAYGYFDSEGVHWTLTDAIGSIELVVSGDGRVEQHTGYYPYGQPWRAVAGQQRLFGGKELRTFAGLNDYDFHARFQNPAGPFFQSADRHAANDPARSPHIFAAANPVRFTDPTGLDKYVVDVNGNIVERIDYEKDVLVLQGNENIKSKNYDKGTIEKQFKISAGKGKYDYFKIKGDQAAVEIFEFLADNTNVEYSLFQCGKDEVDEKTGKGNGEDLGKTEVNFLGTSHERKTDRSGDLIYSNQLLYSYYIRAHRHNHPSGDFQPSRRDMDSYHRFVNLNEYDNDIVIKIYDGKSYNTIEIKKTKSVIVQPKVQVNLNNLRD